MVRQTSSGQLGWYVVLSLGVHLVSIVWMLRALEVISPIPSQPEPVRVTVVAPNLPGSPVPHTASKASTLAAAISQTEILPLALSRPATSMVASAATPEALPAAPTALEPPLKATPKPQIERLTLPAQVPELATPETPQAAPQPAPAPMIPDATPAFPRMPVSMPEPVVPEPSSPELSRPARSPRQQPLREQVSPPAQPVPLPPPTIRTLKPVPPSRSLPLPQTQPLETRLPMSVAAMVTRTAAPTAPLSPQAAPPPPLTPASQRQRPAVAPVSPPSPSVRDLPTMPSLRANTAAKRFPSPLAPSEAASQPLLTPRPLTPPPAVDATAPSALPAQQSPPPKPRQEVAMAPQLVKPSGGPAFPLSSGQEQRSASALGQSASDFVPHFTYKPCPRYPYMARQRGAEGVVALRAELLENGGIGRVDVVKSSGYASLDSAARKAVQQWTHDPSSNGSQLPRWGDVSVNFKLTRSKGSNGHDHAKTPSHFNCDLPR